MDINDVRGLGTVFALFSFLCIVGWAYSSRRKNRFEDDGMIPFMDEDDNASDEKATDSSVEQKNTNDDKGSE